MSSFDYHPNKIPYDPPKRSPVPSELWLTSYSHPNRIPYNPPPRVSHRVEDFIAPEGACNACIFAEEAARSGFFGTANALRELCDCKPNQEN